MKRIIMFALLTIVICTTYANENKQIFIAEKDGKDAFTLEIFKEVDESIFYLNDRGDAPSSSQGDLVSK